MKKSAAAFSIILCLLLAVFAFPACSFHQEPQADATVGKSTATTDAPTEIITPLDRNSEHSAALDRMGYVPGMSEGDFTSLIEAYKYEGIDIMHYPGAVPANYDAENGFGFLLIGEPFSGSYEFQKWNTL